MRWDIGLRSRLKINFEDGVMRAITFHEIEVGKRIELLLCLSIQQKIISHS